MKLLFVSTSVGAIGSGLGGGVELTLKNIAKTLQKRGHQLTVVAPVGSVLADVTLREITGNLQLPAQSQERTLPISMPENSFLANCWHYVCHVQNDYDLILNFAYDWLPFYLTPFLHCPVAHLVSMASVSTVMDQIIQQTYQSFPHLLGFHSHSQASTFGIFSDYFCLENGLDLETYEFCAQPDNYLIWVGRISPEKALEDAVLAAQITGIPLKILGKIQQSDYWEGICKTYPMAPIEYLGFLPTQKLQGYLRASRALMMTPRWVEAFGNVVIEALACGVPVIAYKRGGPAEIITHGKTGFLVEPDNVNDLVKAIQQVGAIHRYTCRQEAEKRYSLEALGDRFEGWFHSICYRSQLVKSNLSRR